MRIITQGGIEAQKNGYVNSKTNNSTRVATENARSFVSKVREDDPYFPFAPPSGRMSGEELGTQVVVMWWVIFERLYFFVS